MPPQLPYDVILSEVLPRLPVKSIGRLQCVCKAWNSFLSMPDFARMHLRYQTNSKLLVLDQHARIFRTLDCGPPLNHDLITTRPTPFNEDVLILASLDGLVCVALMKTRELAFWNPLTGAYKMLRTSFFDDILNGSLAFYIDSSNDYKLVHIVSDGAFIYSWRLDSWRKINTCLEISNYMSSFNWVMASFSCEKVYFKLIRSGGDPWRVISFDVESEKFKEIHLPPVPCGACLDLDLVALNGCIHLYVGYLDVLWILKYEMWRKVGDGWIKVPAFANPKPPGKWYGCREIHTKRTGNWLAVWKDNNSVRNIGLEDLVTDLIYFVFGDMWHKRRGAIYNETLVSPNP